jgi:hypothetical protein
VAKISKRGIGSKSKKSQAKGNKAKPKQKAAGGAPAPVTGTCTILVAGQKITDTGYTKDECRAWAGTGGKVISWVADKK